MGASSDIHKPPPSMKNHMPLFREVPGSVGAFVLDGIAGHGRWAAFVFRTLLGMACPPYKLKPILHEIRVIGFESLSIIVFTGLFTGMVLGLQGYHTLRSFSSEGLLGTGVAISLVTELGPVLSALLLAGRAGSALCAQIGVMRISEQIDALECMAIDVHNHLIAPKLLAGLISLPILALIFCVVGMFGGYIAGCVFLDVNPASYYDGMASAIDWPRLRMCVLKSVFFAFLIVTICAQRGFCVLRLKEKGAAGVSRATTQSVVISSVSILMWDYLLTCVLI